MPVVMMSGHGTIETAVEATKIGAFDFLEKPVGLQKLLTTIARALKTAAAKEPRRVSLAALGTSAPIRDAEKALEQLLAARRPVLILGEPGTGHDIAARALQTPDAPFVALANGARLATNPLALLEEARDGVLYCAEIGQYSKAEQKGLAFLLPKLDKHNVALVCTSAEPLGNLPPEGKFDAALLSALSSGARRAAAAARASRRHSGADRALLARRPARDAAPQRRLLASRCRPAALTALSNAYWPGNLDHLQNVVANLALMLRGEITPDHVKRLLGEAGVAEPGARARDHRALFRAAAARSARGVRAHLLRAAARAASRAT